ncbi:MAG: amidohydrolase family protein [Saprospiraceae bacterium]|nr:amidohydrolase family protein [Saprospiraceae bacterium]
MSFFYRILFVLLLLKIDYSVDAQITFPYNGVKHPNQSCYILINAKVVTDPNSPATEKEIIVRNGKIQNIGIGLKRPLDAVVVDLKGAMVYPAFIDPFSSYGMPDLPERKNQGRGQIEKSREESYGWNDALRTDQNAFEIFKVKESNGKSLRENGFALVNTHQPDGISRGSSVLVFTGNESENQMVLRETVAHHLSFLKGSSTQDYPGSLMGSIALLRQTYLDGNYYEKIIRSEEKNISLQYWNQLQNLIQIFSVEDKLDIFRADKIAKEFGKNYLIRTNGSEYQNIDLLKKIQAKLIVPLKFPELYEVEDPFDADQIDLSDLKHWEMAPYNLKMLAENNLMFCITMDGLKDPKDFLTNLRKAINSGLSKTKALEALTSTPADWLGIKNETGSIAIGKWANFFITNADLFSDTSKILETWVKGKPYKVGGLESDDYSGRYRAILGNENYTAEISKKDGKYDLKILTEDSIAPSVTIRFENEYLNGKWKDKDQKISLVFARKNLKDWEGTATLHNGNKVNFQLSYLEALEKKEAKNIQKTDSLTKDSLLVFYPFMAYGWTEKPQQKSFLIKNVTVWTCETEGILNQTDVLISNGKIEKIGKNISANSSKIEIIDGTGKHLTPGLIDEHNHIAISRGVNECSESSTAEVRIGDVVNSEDINIYRQLAGGLTTAQLLHGSCNPIGGQSALIKLRWGSSPEEMKFEGADPFIKFALGENVKRSGGSSNQRYPDSRMGVEQVYMDYFTRGKQYIKDIQTKGAANVRRDLDLETIAEILQKKRFITCHSYVQSEINMLMKVADKFDIKVNTFTHILEGYKVADKMKLHGAGGSSFSDWWAYKFEVYEAIPYNGALLHKQGVTTAFNSDDAEMARRLNQEAAKAVKYGGVSEEEALKFVTLNPAKLLHIDHRVGSIKIKKDADLVLWNGHPLAVQSHPDMTFVDGIKYFDVQEQSAMRKMIDAERSRIIQKMLKLKESGAKSSIFKSQRRRLYHCDSIEEEIHFDENH